MTEDARALLDLLGERLPSTPLALGATSPGTGPIWMSAGTLPDGRAVTPRTPMYAGSVTKQFIAAVAGCAILDGALDHDDVVGRILPGLPSWAQRVRIRHLVHHTAGLPPTSRLLAELGTTDEADLDNDLVLRALAHVRRLAREPGQVFAYSNAGYVLLAETLRVATGVDPARLARQTLLLPLAMRDSSIGDPPYALRRPPPRTVGDGGLWTSVVDLVRWLDALNRRLLGDQLTVLLEAPGRLDDGTPLDYAWGMTARPDRAGVTYTHGGSWPGWTAKTVRNPGAGTSVALLTRHDDTQLVSDTAMAIHDLLLPT